MENIIKYPEKFEDSKTSRETARFPDAPKMAPEIQIKIPEKTKGITETPKVISEAPTKVPEKPKEKKLLQEKVLKVPKKAPETPKNVTEEKKVIQQPVESKNKTKPPQVEMEKTTSGHKAPLPIMTEKPQHQGTYVNAKVSEILLTNLTLIDLLLCYFKIFYLRFV